MPSAAQQQLPASVRAPVLNAAQPATAAVAAPATATTTTVPGPHVTTAAAAQLGASRPSPQQLAASAPPSVSTPAASPQTLINPGAASAAATPTVTTIRPPQAHAAAPTTASTLSPSPATPVSTTRTVPTIPVTPSTAVRPPNVTYYLPGQSTPQSRPADGGATSATTTPGRVLPPKPAHPLPPRFLLIAFKEAPTEKFLIPLGANSYISRVGGDYVTSPPPKPPQPSPPAEVKVEVKEEPVTTAEPVTEEPVKKRTRASLAKAAPPPKSPTPPPEPVEQPDPTPPKKNPYEDLPVVPGMKPSSGTVLLSTYVPVNEWRKPDWQKLQKRLPFDNPKFVEKLKASPATESPLPTKSPQSPKRDLRPAQKPSKPPATDQEGMLNLAAENFLPAEGHVEPITIRIVGLSDQNWKRFKDVMEEVEKCELETLAWAEPELNKNAPAPEPPTPNDTKSPIAAATSAEPKQNAPAAAPAVPPTTDVGSGGQPAAAAPAATAVPAAPATPAAIGVQATTSAAATPVATAAPASAAPAAPAVSSTAVAPGTTAATAAPASTATPAGPATTATAPPGASPAVAPASNAVSTPGAASTASPASGPHLPQTPAQIATPAPAAPATATPAAASQMTAPPAAATSVPSPSTPTPAPAKKVLAPEVRETWLSRKKKHFTSLLSRVGERVFPRFRVEATIPTITEATADKWALRPYHMTTRPLYTRDQEAEEEGEEFVPLSPELAASKRGRKDPEPTVTFEMPVSLDALDERVEAGAAASLSRRGRGRGNAPVRKFRRGTAGAICEGCGKPGLKVWRRGPNGRGTREYSCLRSGVS